MDNAPNLSFELENAVSLAYDDTLPYSELNDTSIQADAAPPDPVAEAAPSLADRIGANKVYLISDATVAARVGKRKLEEEADLEEAQHEMDEDIEDATIRDNALLFHGTPISRLSTSSLFAYATHFDAHPIALEWIDDTTCILVFSTRTAARTAYRHLSKSPTEQPAEDKFVTAKPIPMALWPPEERINRSLGTGEGLKGVIRMRWATLVDVKSKGSWETSEFYKKYGRKAGKLGEGDERASKRRKGSEEGDRWERADLDAELDELNAEFGRPKPPRPRRTVDKTLLERTSVLRAQPLSLEARIAAPLPRRARSRNPEGNTVAKLSLQDRLTSPQKWNDGRRRDQRQHRTQEELDAELDAFQSNTRDS